MVMESLSLNVCLMLLMQFLMTSLLQIQMNHCWHDVKLEGIVWNEQAVEQIGE